MSQQNQEIQMLKASKRIIVISEKVNKFGFRALVDGIDLDQYLLNPIMLWMHYRAFGDKASAYLPIGNVKELKVEVIEDIGKCITGLPFFDDTDDFAVSLYNKYENGTLRMASAGLLPVEWSEDLDLVIPGQRGATLVRSILEEISMVDIGADNNALSIALYDVNHNRIELSLNSENAAIPLINIDKTEMDKIELTAAKAAALLGVTELETSEQFETKIMEVVQLAARQKTQIETLTREKTEAETKLEEAEKLQLSAKIETLVQGAVDDRKITADEKPEYVKLASASYETVEKLLGTKAGNPTVQSHLEGKRTSTVNLYANKTWSELDKGGLLVKLKAEDRNLFKELFKQEFSKEYEG